MSGDGLIEFYERGTFYEGGGESTRLGSREGRVEFLRTQRILRSLLHPSSTILDVGGADGAHARWLEQDGHQVEIVDVVPIHVEAARTAGLRARVGDARDLSEFSDGAFDAVLLLGPLYHLVTPADRATALAEACRVAKPGGLVAAAAISRIAVALDYLRKGRLGDKEAIEMVSRIYTNGHDDTGFGAGIFYFHGVHELRDELTEAELSEVVVHGLEGPAWPLIAPGTAAHDPIMDQVDAIADLVDGDASVTGASSHLLAIGRLP